MTTTEQQIRAHIREAIKEVKESLESTDEYDDDPALKGDQDELPDRLQKGIIDNATEEKEKSENTAIAEGKTMSNETTEQQVREHIRATIKEIQEEKHAQDVNPLSEPEHLSEARAPTRNAINEVMVGLTPITRIDTQEDANTAMKGNNTNTDVDKAELGFNTFDMQEWASIAGIDENDLSEAISDDTGNSSMLGGSDAPFDNVVDISDSNSDSADEIPGMVVSAVSGDSYDDDVQSMEDEVEDLADEYLANRAEPDVFDIRDFLAEIRKR